MNLKQTIENNLVIYTIIVFFSGATTAWFIIDKLWIGPKDIIIEQLRMGIVPENKYTRSTNKPSNKILPTKKEDSRNSSIKSEPLSLDIYYNMNTDNAERELSKLRKENRLRELGALESGKSISELPTGTFFYLAWVYLDYLNDGSSERFLGVRGADRYKTKSSFYEIHYLDNGDLKLLGFISDTDAANASILDGIKENKLTLFPSICDEVDNLILIPINRILKASYRDITFDSKESSVALDLVLK